MTAGGATLLALAALVPAALNPSLALYRPGIPVALCGGSAGSVVEIPLAPQRLPGSDEELCCGKACHGGSSRKRAGTNADPVQ